MSPTSVRPIPPIMTLTEAAELCRLGRPELITAISRGELLATRIGRRWRVQASDLVQWLDSQRQTGAV